jgi:hypothetical protein
MKLKIKYTLESIYDLPGQQYEERIFICHVYSFYEWRNLLYKTVDPKLEEEIFVKEIKEII